MLPPAGQGTGCVKKSLKHAPSEVEVSLAETELFIKVASDICPIEEAEQSAMEQVMLLSATPWLDSFRF